MPLQDYEQNKLPGGRPYNMSVQTYEKSQNIPVQKGCFAFMFTNVGDKKAYVNDMVIFPNTTPTTALGDSRSISGHMLEIFKGQMNLKFEGGGTSPLVEIVQLFYTDLQ